MAPRREKADALCAIREEVAKLAKDEGDLDEMRVIREQLAKLAPSRPTQTSSSP